MIHVHTAILSDLPGLHRCFEASVRQTCSKDYDTEQIDAWINRASPERWAELFGGDLCFFVAEDTADAQIAGFTSINKQGYLHSMFIHPSYQKQGIARKLLREAESYAIQGQVASVYSEVSLTARPFFEKMGYKVEKEQLVHLNQVTMSNFVMRKEWREITRPAPSDYDEILQVWEASVRATHHFLAEEDILFYKELGPQYFPAVELYIIRDEHERIAAFMGLSDEVIEMLFVHPHSQGKGLGTRLLQFAIQEKGRRKIDVNEQNTPAYQLYLRLGFQVTGRDALDASGKPYPTLHLHLK